LQAVVPGWTKVDNVQTSVTWSGMASDTTIKIG
jgi:hypothetical protein